MRKFRLKVVGWDGAVWYRMGQTGTTNFEEEATLFDTQSDAADAITSGDVTYVIEPVDFEVTEMYLLELGESLYRSEGDSTTARKQYARLFTTALAALDSRQSKYVTYKVVPVRVIDGRMQDAD